MVGPCIFKHVKVDGSAPILPFTSQYTWVLRSQTGNTSIYSSSIDPFSLLISKTWI
jgi:hypothetical protein